MLFRSECFLSLLKNGKYAQGHETKNAYKMFLQNKDVDPKN